MITRLRTIQIVLFFAILAVPGSVLPSDWMGCGFAFDRVSEAAARQSYSAQEMEMIEMDVESKRTQMEWAENELRRCRANPEIYDLLDDGCQSKYYEYERAVDSYNFAVDSYNSSLEIFEMGLGNLRSALSSLQISCAGSF